ncbi:nitroreductase family protein [Histomonas meleagridis]|uniref:nitroreductase family protein n=1 Tax=Histomonas meleagridis TaxID=135588 RepID=UPI003559D46D|nr:nitroreductase family protein [Histomonas meleagridis]KAH0803622.1 nitroreductase family protein [Histomonas meleagridis]
MDVLQAIETRRTVRQYQADYTIPKEDLQKIVDIALSSPTGMNAQGIDLVVCTNRAKIDEATMITFHSWDEAKQARWNNRKQDYGVKNVVSCDASCIVFLVKNERADPNYVEIDAGIMSMAIMEATRHFGLQTMCLGALLWGDKAGLEKCLGIEEGKMVMAVAIGKPIEGELKLIDKKQLCKATYIE